MGIGVSMKKRLPNGIFIFALFVALAFCASATAETDTANAVTDDIPAATVPTCTEEDESNKTPNIAACEHTFDTWSITTAPIKDSNGKMMGVCSHCGMTEIRTIRTEIRITLGQNTYSLNGEIQEMDAAPIIRNDRIMLPVRQVAENLGSIVEWDETLSTATLTTDAVVIKITVGNEDALINGVSVPLDVPAFIENERTYMPVRFVAEMLGGTVLWDGDSSTAKITDAGTCIGKIFDAPYIYQNTDYPNGCESVSTVMALQYWGIDMDTDTFIDNYLDMGATPIIGGIGPDPESVYLGNPRSQAGWGCYSSVITEALDKFIDKDLYCVSQFYDRSLDELCSEYIEHGIPVILWATVGMENSSARGYYAHWETPDGKKISYNMWLHCLLWVGYDESNYYFNDPMLKNADGIKYTAYSKASVEKAYSLLNQQCIVISKNESNL